MSSEGKFFIRNFIILAIFSCLPAIAGAAPYEGEAFELLQPDGTHVNVLVWGDEYYQRVETPDGYTLIKDPATKWICYAELSPDGSEYFSTGEPYTGGAFTAGKSAKKMQLQGKKSLRLKPESKRKKILEKRKMLMGEEQVFLPAEGDPTPGVTPPQPAPAAVTRTGPYKGLTLLIDFPDVPASISRTAIDNFCNQLGYKEYTNYGSIRDYFLAVSGGMLDYTNYVTEYYTAKNNKAYYTDETISYGTRARELIVEALQALEAGGFDFTTLSVASGRIIAVNAMYAGAADNAWSEGLWPHSGTLSTGAFSADGVSARRYQISNIGTSLSIKTFIHENGHLLMQWPDLYDYGGESAGVGNFCIMAGGGNSKRPVPPNPYYRQLSGWETVTAVDSATNAVFTWPVNQTTSLRYGNPADVYEAFYLETRSKSEWNYSLPGAGLVIWHVEGNGSNDNEQMTCDMHYLVSVEQADGLFQLEGDVNSGGATDVWTSANTQGFSDATNPGSNWWCDGASGLVVTEISAAGNTMTFRIGAGTVVPSATPTITPTYTAGTPLPSPSVTQYTSPTVVYTPTVTGTRTLTRTVTPSRTRTATRTASPTLTPPPEGYREMQAESACYFDGASERTYSGYTGTGYVNTYNEAGVTVIFFLDAVSARQLVLTIRYSNGSAYSRNMAVYVNGVVQADDAVFTGTGAWNVWSNSTVTVSLAAGRNEIILEAVTAEGAPMLDLILFTDAGVVFAPCIAPTATVTATATVTLSRTATPEFTQTMTPTATPSRTVTGTFSATMTLTGTATVTPTPTFTATRSATNTATHTATGTVSPSFTATPTSTLTGTRTITATWTVTPTFTDTPTATPDIRPLALENMLIYPNPYNTASGDLNIAVEIIGTAGRLSVRIYTAAFRLVAETAVEESAAGSRVISVPAEKLERLAAGIYYTAVTADTADGQKARARLKPLVIMK